MRVLVLGAYGLIGAAIADRLLAAGLSVAGLGRSVEAARRARPEIDWFSADVATLLRPADWTPFLENVDAVVNAAGALQDSARDNVTAVQRDAMLALYAASEAAGVRRFVQISAVGARADAKTMFMRTKGEADAALVASRLDWTILRPGLVISPAAYGGTALLRGLAGLPLVTPTISGGAPIQTVGVEDVSDAVRAVLMGEIPSRRSYDLVEDEARGLDEVVAAWRASLGRPPARRMSASLALGRALFRMGDVAGNLGWRPPMRSAALKEIEAGVLGDPGPWRAAGGRPMRPLVATLRRLPSTVQERWFGRLFLLKPAIVVTLALFWILSGAIGLAQIDRAAEVLTSRGMAAGLASMFVAAGGLVDLALGLGALHRRTHVAALWGMIATTAAYLVGATLFAPDLWLDPLGPLVKTVPAAMLALVALAIEEER